ncbi:uncharacterized protein LOC106177431 isoform X2 [Lingula anatina]|uniref:Uncharacterized protein LOC106177431 isoform X2 n=1 Tax=Lingula anatina TaxID=7574 RepID=A0A1S3JZ18_LINAN|nr:uncharacterized protein LOC106177431 isoform X2 [Lingula anatina]|eukprot:XP_013415650.1 uncharacterized protein LOC106177431 isoform X2 [Lingula anatina]
MTASSRQPYVYDICLLGHDGRSTSKDFAYALADYLETERNLKVFFDLRDVLPGQDVFSVTDAFKKSKFTVAVMCRAFIQNRLNNYTATSAFVNLLKTGRFIPLYVLDVRKQDINNIQELQKYNAIKGLPFGDAVLPNENPEALDKLRRALTAGISHPEQDDRNNEGQGDVSNEETISQPQEETAPPCEDITGQGRDAVEDGSGENSVQGWMGSLSSFLRDVAPAIWTCILYTENSTPQLFPAKNNAKNGHCKD